MSERMKLIEQHARAFLLRVLHDKPPAVYDAIAATCPSEYRNLMMACALPPDAALSQPAEAEAGNLKDNLAAIVAERDIADAEIRMLTMERAQLRAENERLRKQLTEAGKAWWTAKNGVSVYPNFAATLNKLPKPE